MDPSDELLARLALQRGWISRRVHDEVLERAQSLQDRGLAKSVEDALREGRHIVPEQLRVLRRLLGRFTNQARIGDYYVVRRIGIGGTGMVFEARHRRLGRNVALKILFPRLEREHTRMAERFLNEAKVLARVAHPNVVHAYDAGKDGAFYYIAMELVRGENLAAIIRDTGPLPVREALELLLPVVSALDAIHRAGLVHRDVKPANILISPSGAVKLVDLGLFFADEGREVTWDGMVFGTPHYMSPEQIRSDPDIDARSDLYSFGVTLYHAVSGELPFDADTPQSIARAHLQQPSRPLRHCRPDLPLWFDELLGKLLQKRREDRPRTASEVVEAMSGFLQDYYDVEPRVPTLAREDFAHRAARRSGRWILAGAALALVALALVFWPEDAPEPIAEPTAVAPPNWPPGARETTPVTTPDAEAMRMASEGLAEFGRGARERFESYGRSAVDLGRAIARDVGAAVELFAHGVAVAEPRPALELGEAAAWVEGAAPLVRERAGEGVGDSVDVLVRGALLQRNFAGGIAFALSIGEASWARDIDRRLAPDLPAPVRAALDRLDVGDAAPPERLVTVLALLARDESAGAHFASGRWEDAAVAYGALANAGDVPGALDERRSVWADRSVRSRRLAWIASSLFRVRPELSPDESVLTVSYAFDSENELGDFRLRSGRWAVRGGRLVSSARTFADRLDTVALFRLPVEVQGTTTGRFAVLFEDFAVGVGGLDGEITFFDGDSLAAREFLDDRAESTPSGTFRIVIDRERFRAEVGEMAVDSAIGRGLPEFGRVAIVARSGVAFEHLSIIGTPEPRWLEARILADAESR